MSHPLLWNGSNKMWHCISVQQTFLMYTLAYNTEYNSFTHYLTTVVMTLKKCEELLNTDAAESPCSCGWSSDGKAEMMWLIISYPVFPARLPAVFHEHALRLRSAKLKPMWLNSETKEQFFHSQDVLNQLILCVVWRHVLLGTKCFCYSCSHFVLFFKHAFLALPWHSVGLLLVCC